MNQPAPPQRRRRWWWLAILASVPLALLGYRGVRQSLAQARLDAAIAEADADNPHWRLEQLQEEYDHRPVNEHLVTAMEAYPRAPVYLGWYGDDIVYRTGKAYDLDRHPNARMPGEYLKTLRERSNDPRLEAMRRALQALAAYPEGRLPDRYRLNDGFTADRFRSVANFQLDEILLAIQENRTDDAIRAVQVRLRLCEPLEECPSPLVRLVQIAVTAGTFQHVQALLGHGDLSPEQLTRLQEVLMGYDRADALRLARLLRADMHDFLNRLHTDAKAREDYWKMMYPTLPPNTPTAERLWGDMKRYTEIQLFTQSLTDTHAGALESLNSLVAKAKLNPDVLEAEETWANKGLFVRKQLASTAKITGAHATLASQLRSAYVAVACERYRLATGRWPAAVQDLVPLYLPRVPLDPYTGKPLLYRVLPDGAVVYSVSRNHADDGGDVLYQAVTPKDRGMRLYTPDRRGLKYEAVYKPE